jgi:hypothetical protein
MVAPSACAVTISGAVFLTKTAGEWVHARGLGEYVHAPGVGQALAQAGPPDVAAQGELGARRLLLRCDAGTPRDAQMRLLRVLLEIAAERELDLQAHGATVQIQTSRSGS